MQFTKTGYLSDQEVELRGTYEPEERQTRDYPGSPAGVVDFEVWLVKQVSPLKTEELEITQFISKDEIEALKDRWLEEVGDPKKDAMEAEAERRSDEERGN